MGVYFPIQIRQCSTHAEPFNSSITYTNICALRCHYGRQYNEQFGINMKTKRSLRFRVYVLLLYSSSTDVQPTNLTAKTHKSISRRSSITQLQLRPPHRIASGAINQAAFVQDSRRSFISYRGHPFSRMGTSCCAPTAGYGNCPVGAMRSLLLYQ